VLVIEESDAEGIRHFEFGLLSMQVEVHRCRELRRMEIAKPVSYFVKHDELQLSGTTLHAWRHGRRRNDF
jgi:hypothetical protein